ncbi:MAG: Na(+)-translocating NADH-quinone reductase subunit A [Acidobacteriota bacterium]
MAVHKVKKGLRLPISGEPEQRIDDARAVRRVALLGADYVGLKPTMHVAVGDEVQRGQLMFEDKKTPGVRFTAPGGGKIVAINRGERRAFQSLVIELSDEERSGNAAAVRFSSDTGKHPRELDRDQVRDLLLESGLWTALRARPFGRVADPSQAASSIFVTAIDTHPLAADPSVVLAGREGDFERGLEALAKLIGGPVYVCAAPGKEPSIPSGEQFRLETFSGPHPAGLVGYHIHVLDPVHREKTVWYLGYQDVVAIGKLFNGGDLDPTRVVAFAGPPVARPRLLRTRLGAATADLIDGELDEGEMRVISGSVLSGRIATDDVHGFLGRYDRQVSVLREDRDRPFLGWLMPGFDRFSMLNTFGSALTRGASKQYPMTTTTWGSDRAIVPVVSYEKVFPYDILPLFLLRALVMNDIERAEELGVLELEEEDLAVCTYVCPGKHDYGPHLRKVLTTIEKEG